MGWHGERGCKLEKLVTRGQEVTLSLHREWWGWRWAGASTTRMDSWGTGDSLGISRNVGGGGSEKQCLGVLCWCSRGGWRTWSRWGVYAPQTLQASEPAKGAGAP